MTSVLIKNSTKSPAFQRDSRRGLVMLGSALHGMRSNTKIVWRKKRNVVYFSSSLRDRLTPPSRTSIYRSVNGTWVRSDTVSVLRPIPWMFVGLGNPGPRYTGTRHNVGFDLVDHIAAAHGIRMDVRQCKSICGKGHIADVPVLLAKPLNYLDIIGGSVGALVAYYRLPLFNVVLMMADMRLPCGLLRLTRGGGHAGHLGVKSVIQAFKRNQDFIRLRVGIGKQPSGSDPKAFKLETFHQTEIKKIDVALSRGVEAARILVLDGFGESIFDFNENQNRGRYLLKRYP